MFFKMLKNDLKLKKGLNIILFVFILFASVLMFISASQLYMQLTGSARTAETCRLSDILMMFSNTAEKREENLACIEKLLQEDDTFADYEYAEGLLLAAEQIDFDKIDESDQESFFEPTQFVTTQPHTYNQVFDLHDRPFYVQNGTVWISHKMRDVTGAVPGDRMRIITPMGRVYELEIGGIYKEPTEMDLFRYYLSEDDFAVISEDYPIRTDVFAVTETAPGTSSIENFINAVKSEKSIRFPRVYAVKTEMTDDYIITFIITCAIILISIFMLAIILMTIRFTMVSAMRDEEKEIGMMRAMGVDSLRFRWLFAAKFIAFAVVGGVFGVIIGLPLSKKVMRVFSGGMTLPSNGILIAVGAAAAFLMTAVIILFSLLVMRRINRISVIDAIHGENHGERFGRVSALLLHRRRKMPVPVYLALSDILTRFKRYIFLIVAYTLGGMLILLTSYLYHSVINVDFMKYEMVYSYDFFPDFSDEMMKEAERREIAENKDFWEIFNDDLESNGIAAHADLHKVASCELVTGGSVFCRMYFGFENPSVIQYSEGRAPVLANEAAISSYTAKQRGIQIGDEIDVIIDEYSDDMLTVTANEKKLLITALIDFMEFGAPTLVMGSEYDQGADDYLSYTGMHIDSDNKQAEYDKMVEFFGGHMMTGEEAVDRYLADYELPLRMLRNVVSGTVIFINILLTMLYMNIFVSEDKSEIALQRCIGFEDSKIRAAQLFRMLMLTVFASLAAILLATLLGPVFFSALFSIIGLSGFQSLPMPLLTWVIMPAVTILTVLIPSLIRLRNINQIDISSIASE